MRRNVESTINTHLEADRGRLSGNFLAISWALMHRVASEHVRHERQASSGSAEWWMHHFFMLTCCFLPSFRAPGPQVQVTPRSCPPPEEIWCGSILRCDESLKTKFRTDVRAWISSVHQFTCYVFTSSIFLCLLLCYASVFTNTSGLITGTTFPPPLVIFTTFRNIPHVWTSIMET